MQIAPPGTKLCAMSSTVLIYQYFANVQQKKKKAHKLVTSWPLDIETLKKATSASKKIGIVFIT